MTNKTWPRIASATAMAAACLCASGCAQGSSSAASAATPADAKAFLANVNATSLTLGIQQAQAGWVQQTFITDDTEAISARANQAANDAGARFAKESTKYDKVRGVRRRAARAESAQGRRSSSRRRRIRRSPTSCRRSWRGSSRRTARASGAPSRRSRTPARTSTTSRASSRRHGDEKALRAAWEGWHTIAPPMRKDYAALRRAVEQGREGTGLRRHRRDVAQRSTTCRPTTSRRSSIGCGIRCGRST